MSARHGVVVLAEPEDEGELVRAIDAEGEDMCVVRRCADLPELRAAVRAGIADLAVISALEADLDAIVVEELRTAGAAVILLVEESERAEALRLGAHALASRGAPDQVVDALRAHLRALPDAAAPDEGAPAEDAARIPDLGPRDMPWPPEDVRPGARLLVVWGTSGAPGRSTIAIGLAHALAEYGKTLLIDADVVNPSLAHMTGTSVDGSGLAALARRASRGALDAQALDSALTGLAPGLSLLTGLSSPHRWREIGPGALAEILALARLGRSFVVVDVAPTSLEALSSQIRLHGDRDETTMAALRSASDLLALARADVLGISRLSYALEWWAENGSGAEPRVVVNRVASSSTGPRPASALDAALSAILPGGRIHLIPEDPAVAKALLAGRSCVSASPKSPSALAIRELAASLAAPTRTRGARRRGRGGVKH